METIAALATGTGGAISIIRLSGDNAIAIADSVFRPASGTSLCAREGYTITLGRIIDGNGQMVDEVLVSLFRAPRSYTGEDMVEISAHASSYVCSRILELLIGGGARTAHPGEFTMRAFMAGKMDLSQAEAVADMIASADRASHAMATNQLRGGYSVEFAALRGELLRLASLLELELDFSQEEVEFADRSQLDNIMSRIGVRIEELITSFSLGNALKDGVPVVIVGHPNVGKSTLLNAILKDDRAMVSDIAGTTRDVIEESVVIDGVRFRFLDTAGLRTTVDPLEKMGIERTYSSIDRALIVLWVVDARYYFEQSYNFDTLPFTLREDQQICLIINKMDCLTPAETKDVESAISTGKMAVKVPFTQRDITVGSSPALQSSLALQSSPALQQGGFPDTSQSIKIASIVPVTAKSKVNINAITSLLARSIATTPLYHGSTVVSNTRHLEALTRASDALQRARTAMCEGLPADLLADDIRHTLHYLGEITGEITTDEILGEIFSRFCIGK